MMTPFKLTTDGFETQWQVNALAPQVFVMSLLPILMQTASTSSLYDRVRVVNVVSDMAFRGPSTLQLNDVNMTDAKGVLELMQRYAHSKQATIRLTGEMNNRYNHLGMSPQVIKNHFSDWMAGISSYSVHPGIVQSNLQSSDPTIVGTVMRTMMKLGAHTTALEGSYNTLFCAVSPQAAAVGRGKYFTPVGKLDSKADKWLNDHATNDQLWELCEAQLRRIS
jgi:NAD(P)-dependent dehydrogenase (short-subunit alcohol dehydrogenase family)